MPTEYNPFLSYGVTYRRDQFPEGRYGLETTFTGVIVSVKIADSSSALLVSAVGNRRSLAFGDS